MKRRGNVFGMRFMRRPMDKPPCPHPPHRLYTWFVTNPYTGKDDVLCVGCCDCGKVLQGAEGEKASSSRPTFLRKRNREKRDK